MARPRRKTGDDATNARKRYYRAAERYLKQAKTAVGATAARLRSLAQLRLQDALETYSKFTTQAFAKPIQRIASALGIDLNVEREKIKKRTDKQEKEIRSRAISEEKSNRAKWSRQNTQEMREAEARALLNSPIGSRIIGGTVEIWEDKARIETETGTKIDNRKILPALYDYFGVDNLADLLDTMQDIAGENLFSQLDQEAFYESAKISIQTYIKNQRQ